MGPADMPAAFEQDGRRPAMRLVASDLACIRGGRQVFSGLACNVAAGEALLVTGPNGAGKSTLLRLVAGLVPAAGGRIVLHGGDPELTVGEQAHYLGHQDAVKPALSVQENLGFWSCFLGGADAAGAAALTTVGLGGISHLPAGYLSAGQRRRLSIARLIAAPRSIWLLDEPTSALDTAGQATLATLMAQHLADGGLILAATHGPIGLESAKELRLDPLARQAPSPLVGEGWGGGSACSEFAATPTPDPSAQGGGETRDPSWEEEPKRPSGGGQP
jgi:heme exporter protein A